jgi:uncharacterized protein (TIGR03437 family)
MRKVFLVAFLAASFTGVCGAQQQLTVVSAASPNVGVAADSLATVFGPSISTETLSALSPPWPVMLGDISIVNVKDSTGTSKSAGILFISQSQMNIYIPAGVAPGLATLLFPVTGLPPGVGAAALRQVNVNIQNTAPALFSAAGTGTGVAAATAVQIVIPSTTQWPVPVFQCNQPGNCVALPIALGVDTPIYVSLYGTGIRNANSVMVNIGGISVQPTYAGPQNQYPGLDQINFPLSLNLRGSGLVNVTVTADGVISNAVQLAIQ